MKRANTIASILWVGLGFSMCLGALKLGLGTPSDPGSGFLPFGTGMLVSILGFQQLWVVFRKQHSDDGQSSIKGAANWKRPACVVAILAFYGVLLPHLGYLVATFLAMLGLFTIYDHRRWGLASAGSLFITILTYVLFHEFLSVQLPAGLLRLGR
jgi:hypothetical protein